MNPMLITVLFAVLVGGMVVLLFLAFNKGGEEKAADRLDALVGRNVRKDSSSDLLLKQTLLDSDKKTLLDRLTPEFFNLTKMFEQADANIKPSALFGISVGLAAVGGALSLWAVNMYVAPSGAVRFFSMPWLWLYHKRASRLKRSAGQLPDGMALVARALR